MTLHQLRIFRAVAHHRSLSRAAEQLHLTQPAVSMQMKDLQEEVRLVLYEVGGRRLRLTEAGELLEQYAERILVLVDEMSVALRELSEARGVVRVGASSTPGVFLLPEIIAEYERDHPGVRVRFEVANSREIEERIVSGVLDFALTGGPLTCSGVVSEPWGEDELVVIVGAGHPWAGCASVPPERVARERLIAREEGSGTRHFYESALHRLNVLLPPSVEMVGVEAVKRGVEAGLGIAFISEHSVRRETAEKRLHVVRLEGIRLARPISLIQQARKHFTSAAAGLVEAVRRARPGGAIPPRG